MNNNDKTFTPERLDEQIEQPANLLAPDEQRLVQDLWRTYQAYEHENTQSLQRVWERLERERQEQNPQAISANAPISLQQRKQMMKDTSSSDSSTRSSIKRTLSLIAAVIVVAVLAGSAALIFGTAGRNNVAHNQNNTASKKPTSTPVVNSSGIYITYRDKQGYSVLDKLDTKTHKSLWTFRSDKLEDLGYPTVYGDTIYLSAVDNPTGQSHLIALSATTGKVRWDVPFKVLFKTVATGNSFNMSYLSDAVVADGQVFVLNQAGTLFAFNSETGKQNWTYDIGTTAIVETYYIDPETGKKMPAGSTSHSGSMPVVSDGVLYGSLHDTLYAVSAKNGKRVWSTKLPSEEQVYSGAQVVDGVVYTTSTSASEHHGGQIYQSYVYAFNKKDGKQNWTYFAKDQQIGEFTVDNGQIYFTSNTINGTTLYALNMQGEKLWEHHFEEFGVYWLTAGNGYVSVSKGTFNQGNVTSYTLYVLKASGESAWQKDVVADPISIVDGVLYTKSGLKIIAFDLANQKELWEGQYGYDLVDKMGMHSEHLGYINVVP